MVMTEKEKALKYKDQRMQYYRENREIILKKKRAERESDLELYRQFEREYAREYRKKNLEKVTLYQKQYQAKLKADRQAKRLKNE